MRLKILEGKRNRDVGRSSGNRLNIGAVSESRGRSPIEPGGNSSAARIKSSIQRSGAGCQGRRITCSCRNFRCRRRRGITAGRKTLGAAVDRRATSRDAVQHSAEIIGGVRFEVAERRRQRDRRGRVRKDLRVCPLAECGRRSPLEPSCDRVRGSWNDHSI